MDTPFLSPLGLLFLLCTSDQQKHKLCREPSIPSKLVPIGVVVSGKIDL